MGGRPLSFGLSPSRKSRCHKRARYAPRGWRRPFLPTGRSHCGAEARVALIQADHSGQSDRHAQPLSKAHVDSGRSPVPAPKSRASSAPQWSPVSMYRIALPQPASLGNRTVEPPPGKRPCVFSSWAKRVSADAMRMSATRKSSWPMFQVSPCTTATAACLEGHAVPTDRCHRIGSARRTRPQTERRRHRHRCRA